MEWPKFNQNINWSKSSLKFEGWKLYNWRNDAKLKSDRFYEIKMEWQIGFRKEAPIEGLEGL